MKILVTRTVEFIGSFLMLMSLKQDNEITGFGNINYYDQCVNHGRLFCSSTVMVKVDGRL